MLYRLKAGNLFILANEQKWTNSPDSAWDSEDYPAAVCTQYLGQRFIDSMLVCVFKCADARVRAQLESIARCTSVR